MNYQPADDHPQQPLRGDAQQGISSATGSKMTAIASLICSLVAWPCAVGSLFITSQVIGTILGALYLIGMVLGVFFGFIALNQIRGSSPGVRRLAIAGIVVSALALAFLAPSGLRGILHIGQ